MYLTEICFENKEIIDDFINQKNKIFSFTRLFRRIYRIRIETQEITIYRVVEKTREIFQKQFIYIN